MIYVTVVKVSVYFDIILKSFPEKTPQMNGLIQMT